MLDPAGREQEKGRSGGGRQGRPAMSADSSDRESGARCHTSPTASHRPEDDHRRAGPVGGPQYWRLPIDIELLE